MKKNTATFSISFIMALSLLFFGCDKKKDPTPPSPAVTYASLAEFFTSNTVKSEFFSFDAASGGSFTSAKGTKITIKANSFVDQSGNPVTGNVKVEFKDIYKKSDMLLSQMPVMLPNGAPLKSAGEFFIKATKDSVALNLAPKQAIKIEQPADGAKVDTLMKPFVFGKGLTGVSGWQNANFDTMAYLSSSYVFSLYNFANPVGNGTWCNSDNPNYFSAYTPTTLTILPDFADSAYSLNIFLIFKGVNSMVHVYGDGANHYPYQYAPTGLSCTAVAVGYKDKKLYASYTDITISAGQTVHVPISETTEADFIAKLGALNN